LSELKVNPLQKEVDQKKKVEFEKRTLLIKGFGKDDAALDIWLQELKKMPWVKKLSLENITKDKKTARLVFVLKIKF